MIMIDYIKIDPIVPREIWGAMALKKFLKIDAETGEIIREEATHKNLEMAYYPSGRLILKGSIHKSFNRGFNHDDFIISNLRSHIIELNSFLGIDLFRCQLRNVEYGVNINPPIHSRKIIEGLLFYRSTEFKDMNYMSKGICRKAEFERYQIKCYDKRAQCLGHGIKIEPEILRIEIHVNRMDYLGSTGIATLGDLFYATKLDELREDLLAKWMGCLFFDPTVTPGKPGDQNRLNQWSNAGYFRALREAKGGMKKVMREIKAFDEYMITHSENIKQKVALLINAKWNQLSNSCQS